MADRIRFKLYRIPQPVSYEVDKNTKEDTREIQSWQYIMNKTDADIDRSQANVSDRLVGYIQLAPQDVLGEIDDNDLINPLPVFETNNTENDQVKYIVYIGTNVYFIVRDGVEIAQLEPLPRVFEFYVNPQRISFNRQKLITEVRTRGGWDIQHWGEKLTEITVEGITGGLHRDISNDVDPGNKGQVLSDGVDISKSSAWQSLRTLRTLYEVDHGAPLSKQSYKIGFSIYEDFYTGYFRSFNGPEILADKPYLMTYSFVFVVETIESDNPLRLEYLRSSASNANPANLGG